MNRAKHCFKFMLITAVTLVIMSGGALAAKEKVYELKFTHQNPPQATTTKLFLDPYMRQIEEVTGNRVKVVSYPAQSLAAANQNFSAIEGGIADMGWVQLSYHTGRFPLTEVMGLPFIGLPSAADNSIVVQQLYEQMPAVQKHFSTVKVLFLHTSDSQLFFTKKPLRTLDDFKGLKIRTLGAMPAKMLVALNATPLFLAMPEIYEAGEKGVIDAAHMGWAVTSVSRTGEVFPYWTDINTTVDIFGMLMNLDVWNELPADIQEQIMSVSGQAGAEFTANAAWGPNIRQMVEDSLAEGKFKFERVELAPGELAKIEAVAKDPLWEEWVVTMTKKKLPAQEILDKTLELIEARRNM